MSSGGSKQSDKRPSKKGTESEAAEMVGLPGPQQNEKEIYLTLTCTKLVQEGNLKWRGKNLKKLDILKLY